jgi:hypothetical protein
MKKSEQTVRLYRSGYSRSLIGIECKVTTEEEKKMVIEKQITLNVQYMFMFSFFL